MTTPPIDPIAVLRHAAITRNLDERALARLAQVSALRRLGRSQMLFGEGEPSTALHIVCQGRLRVVRTSDEGNELVLSVVGTGGTIGELSVFDGEPRSATVIASIRPQSMNEQMVSRRRRSNRSAATPAKEVTSIPVIQRTDATAAMPATELVSEYIHAASTTVYDQAPTSRMVNAASIRRRSG